MINYKQAKNILIKSKIKIKDEIIDSSKSLNRINTLDIYSTVNYPAGTNAAFDGFAINSKETIKLKDSLLYFVKSNNKRHNIFGLWSIDLLDVLEDDMINNNFRKVEDWANKIGVKTIDIEVKKFDPFFNINTKEDFEKAKEILKKN